MPLLLQNIPLKHLKRANNNSGRKDLVKQKKALIEMDMTIHFGGRSFYLPRESFAASLRS